MNCCLKKIIPILIFSLFCASVGTVCASVISIDSQTGRAGDTVTFTVSAGDVSDTVQALGFEVFYDATVLQFRGFSAGSLTQGFSHFSANNTDFGTVRVGGFDAGENQIAAGASGTLLKLNFEAVGEKDSALQIRNLLDDIKGWTVRDGSFSVISEDEEREENEESTAETEDNTENRESGESVGTDETDSNTEQVTVISKSGSEDSVGFSSLPETAAAFQEQTDESIGNFTAETVGDEEKVRKTEEPQEKVRRTKSENKRGISDLKRKIPVAEKKESEQTEIKTESQPATGSVSQTYSKKEISSLNAREVYSGIGLWHWLIFALLLLILAELTGIFWQILKIKQITERR